MLVVGVQLHDVFDELPDWHSLQVIWNTNHTYYRTTANVNTNISIEIDDNCINTYYINIYD